ncbi:hypothetical protein MF672_006280 [Actinomadura sp. ATCC 31491]|uniref:Uncharacterized protein n=1 Tax=Actinomadura luzonensis TaxID=2805427 RepID=A0ABT0FM47_9ACTN|nr:hypothetical protein [Actinomadura luzonensis]MCK2213402.1 hypothetical protein [Actinomadura luzonensis]
MNDSPQEERPIERGGSEEASGAPLTPAEEEARRRPPGVTPGVTPGTTGDEGEGEFERRKELNPDDFE